MLGQEVHGNRLRTASSGTMEGDGMSLDIYLLEDYCHECGRGDEVFWQNITHNLTKMADEAGIYKVLWRPSENSILTAKQLIEPLGRAITMMKDNPARFEKHNPANGWGSYQAFVPWLEKLLEACEKNPDARVKASA
jgi:hypothetical protein